MAILNNLREVKAWLGSSSPHQVPQWEVESLLRRLPAQEGHAVIPSRTVPSTQRLPTEVPPSAPDPPPAFAANPRAPASNPPPHTSSLPLQKTDYRPPMIRPAERYKPDMTPHNKPLPETRAPEPGLAPERKQIPRAEAAAPLMSSTQIIDSDKESEDLIDLASLGVSGLKRQAAFDRQPKKLHSDSPGLAGKVAAGSATERPHISLSRHASTLSTDTSVHALQKYIKICEEKINLLTKCNAVNDSTSLSLDAKKNWQATSYTPKMKAIDESLASLRSGFTFLDPLPRAEEMSNISSDASLNRSYQHLFVPSSSDFVPTPEPIIPTFQQPVKPVVATFVPTSKPVVESFVSPPKPAAASPPKPSLFDSPPLVSLTDDPEDEPDFSANLREAREAINRTKSNPPPKQSADYDARDDSEDNFGEGFMNGLQSSQIDDDDTDLSGFVAKDDEDSQAVDVTYASSQPTQANVQVEETDEDDISSVGDTDAPFLDELENIRLSQDVAQRLGVTYAAQNEPIEISDDENEINNGDFTTQLNEGRDEVVEIPSDDDLDDDDLDGLKELSFIKTEQSTQKPHILSESDFSDDDDELIQLSKNVGTKSSEELARRVIPGSENFIDEVYEVLNNTFKLNNFRPNQLEAVVSTLKGKDVFVLIPTGGGKSLCYQLPALVKGGKTRGTTIVISPLISLMQDQIQHMQAKNIRAGMISSKGTAEERNATFKSLTSGQLDLVYLSPEMVNNSVRVQKVIEKLHENDMLARVVVDEAHCVSSWGHDFRPDYKGMSRFKQKFPRVPVMALTATANEKVRLDIIHNLQMNNPVLLKQSFNRTNLFYEVKNKPANTFEWIRDYVKQSHPGQTGIIYCHSKQSCENTAQKLDEWGISCMFYHAGMDPNERFQVQTDWQTNKIKIICATIAFGMGIDKPDVRFVIHLYIPRSLEGYYQETGRAGRDGNESSCIMFYSYKDARSLQSLIQRDDKLEESAREMHLSKLRQVVQYCENQTDCRRQQVLHFFNEKFSPKDCQKMCDNCCNGTKSVARDVTDHCVNIVKLVESLQGEKVTVIHCQDVYKGSRNGKILKLGHQNSPHHGKGKDLDRGDIERIFFHLQSEGALLEYQVMKGGFASTYVRLGPNAQIMKRGTTRVELQFAHPSKRPLSSNNASNSGPVGSVNPRFRDSFMSAREVIHQDQEKENTHWPVPSEKIVLPKRTFGGRVTDANSEAIEHCLNELRNQRALKSSELGYGRPNYFIDDNILKEMAIKLPTNARDFGKLEGMTKEKLPHFQHFKKVLGVLARGRKKAASQGDFSTQSANSTLTDLSSTYFSRSQSKNSQSKKRGRSQNKSYKNRGSQKSSQRSKKPTNSHIRQMPI